MPILVQYSGKNGEAPKERRNNTLLPYNIGSTEDEKHYSWHAVLLQELYPALIFLRKSLFLIAKLEKKE
jgi:hypothetical protein